MIGRDGVLGISWVVIVVLVVLIVADAKYNGGHVMHVIFPHAGGKAGTP